MSTKRYVVVAERSQPDNQFLPFITTSHLIDATNLPHAVDVAQNLLQSQYTTNYPTRILSVREAHSYPQSFIDADESNMIEILKRLAGHHSDIVSDIDDMAEVFQSYEKNLEFHLTVQELFFLLQAIPSFKDVSCSIINNDYDTYVIIERFCQSLDYLSLSQAVGLRHLTTNRNAEGKEGLAALLCGIRNILIQLG